MPISIKGEHEDKINKAVNCDHEFTVSTTCDNCGQHFTEIIKILKNKIKQYV